MGLSGSNVRFLRYTTAGLVGVYSDIMKQPEAVARARQVLTSVVLLLMLCSCGRATLQSRTSAKPLTDRQVAVLNELRDEINLTYGFVDGGPRINRGPCGRFARIFHEQWNARFKEKINIVFVMMPDIP